MALASVKCVGASDYISGTRESRSRIMSDGPSFCFNLPAPLAAFHVTEYRMSDERDIIRLLNIPQIALNLFSSPWPYTSEHFKQLLIQNHKHFVEYQGVKYSYDWAIRNGEGQFIGSVGCKEQSDGPHFGMAISRII